MENLHTGEMKQIGYMHFHRKMSSAPEENRWNASGPTVARRYWKAAISYWWWDPVSSFPSFADWLDTLEKTPYWMHMDRCHEVRLFLFLNFHMVNRTQLAFMGACHPMGPWLKLPFGMSSAIFHLGSFADGGAKFQHFGHAVLFKVPWRFTWVFRHWQLRVCWMRCSCSSISSICLVGLSFMFESILMDSVTNSL